jgi:carboxynorspermidine decarboxylase
VVEEELLKRNLELLAGLKRETGCRILLAQKAFSMFSLYPLIGRTLCGTTASSLFEARLGREHMGGETHIFSPAFIEREFDEIAEICGHIVFNSFAQFERYNTRAIKKGVSCGIRVNPEYSEQTHAIYDPCAPASRLGVTAANFPKRLPAGVEGLHFHTLCEQNSDALAHTLEVFLQKFGRFLPGLKWVNFGGGHHITRPDYDLETLKECILRVKNAANVEVYLEPGEAVVLNTGVLCARVLDVVYNGMDIAILDASAACHMPDVLEMPYRPEIADAGKPGEKPYTFRLAGNTCLAGDVIGDYSFVAPLTPGSPLIFRDMAHYTMVKNNTFNGVNLPAIAVAGADGGVRVIKQFGYEDFKSRLS